MKWIGISPRRWQEVIVLLQTVIRERARAFGMENFLAIRSMQNPSAPTDALRNRVQEIRDAIINLTEYSLDPRKLGQWAATTPFSPFRSKGETLCGELGIDWGDFMCERLRPVCNWKFVEACYKLLNDIILYRSPQFTFYATPGDLGLEGVEHFRSLEPGVLPFDDYDRSFSAGGSAYYLARWCADSDRRWCDRLHFFNNGSPVTITGRWQSRFSGNVLHRSNLNDNTAFFSWERVDVDWQDGTSADLTLPLPANLVQQVLYEHASGISREELLLEIDLPNEIRLSAANLPELHYTYKD